MKNDKIEFKTNSQFFENFLKTDVEKWQLWNVG